MISNAATGNENVKALVYLAAFLPDKGERRRRPVGQVPRQHPRRRAAPVPTTNADGSQVNDLYIQSDGSTTSSRRTCATRRT